MAWDANPEPDVIGYRLHDGITPGTYPNRLDAGSATTKTISPIARGTYYMIVTAYNTAGLESLPSEELKVVVGSAIDTQSPMISGLPGEIVTVPDSPGGRLRSMMGRMHLRKVWKGTRRSSICSTTPICLKWSCRWSVLKIWPTAGIRWPPGSPARNGPQPCPGWKFPQDARGTCRKSPSGMPWGTNPPPSTASSCSGRE